MPRAVVILAIVLATAALVASGLVVATNGGIVALAPDGLGPAPPTYNVTFYEDGLPANTSWSVEVFGGWGPHVGGSGGSHSSDGNSITFSLPNGTYSYRARAPIGFVSNESHGQFSVTGNGSVVVEVNFTALETYPVTFEETGLPGGTNWSVAVIEGGRYGGWYRSYDVASSNTTFLNLTLVNGTYLYRVLPVPGFVVNGSFGWVSVNGTSPPNVNVTFTLLDTYAVSFNESGLPPGTNWTVTVFANGCSGGHGWKHQSWSSTSNTSLITLSLPNGSYRYRISAGPGFVTNDSFGGFQVAGGSPSAINVSFSPAVEYAVTFNESGLPTGTNWTVLVFGYEWGEGFVWQNSTSSSSNLTFELGNGTYGYAIEPVPGWHVPWSQRFGELCVQGTSPPEVSVQFTSIS